MVSGERVKQARELRGLTQTELAKRIGKDQSAIAYIERGGFQPTEEVLEAISLQTGFPLAFFRLEPSTGFPSGSLQFRARRMSSGQRTQAYQYAKTAWEAARSLAEQVNEIPVRVPRLADDPETAAAVTRSELGLPPDRPVKHVVNTVEKGGVLVIAVPIPLKKWDAYCVWAGEEGEKPVIVVASEAPGDRLRLSVAHELGHLVMHRSLDGDLSTIDREANQFAAEFLMPEVAMREELVPPVTLTSLSELKPRWGVSIQALIRRAYSLRVISERQYRYLNEQLSKYGWKKQEPPELAIPIEKPRAFRKMAELFYGDAIDYKRLASDLSLTPQFLREILDLHADRTEVHLSRERQAPKPGKLMQFPDRKRSRVDDHRRREAE